jgi:hypothetical protein
MSYGGEDDSRVVVGDILRARDDKDFLAARRGADQVPAHAVTHERCERPLDYRRSLGNLPDAVPRQNLIEREHVR